MRDFKVLSIVLLFVVATRVWAIDDKNAVNLLEGRIDLITPHYLYIKEVRYPISQDVEVYLYSTAGPKIDLKTIAGVGFVDRAIVYVNSGSVIKVVVQEVSQ